MNWYLLHISALPESAYAKWYAVMDARKRRKTAALCFQEDKQRTVFADMLARLALSAHVGCAPESIVFSTRPGGKPFAPDLPTEFNVSHCDDLVVCIVDDRPVGIDVEKIRPISHRLLLRVCSPQECAFVLGGGPLSQCPDILEDNSVLERFFRIWTAKEAYTKYTGTGLTVDLHQIHVDAAKIRTSVYGEYVISLCGEGFCVSTDVCVPPPRHVAL